MGKDPRGAPARFEGFADRDARFFKALAKHQDRDWFAAHRDEYEQGWLAPMKALLAEVREKLAPRYAARGDRARRRCSASIATCASRRTSRRTRPTSAAISASRAAAPDRAARRRSTCTSARASSSSCAGQYMMDGEQLKRFRAARRRRQARRRARDAPAPLTRAGFTVDSHEQLQRVPRGFDPEHPARRPAAAEGPDRHVPGAASARC